MELKMNVIINHLVVTKAQIQRICSWILSATEGLVPPWDARGGKNTACVPEQDLVWLLGVAGFMKILVCLHYRSCEHRLGVESQVCHETHMCSWDPPATSLLSLALRSFSDPVLTCHKVMFPDGSCIENFHTSGSSLPQLWLWSIAFCSWWNIVECCYTALAYITVHTYTKCQVTLCSSSLVHFIPVQVISLYFLFSFFCDII